jgi:hypothetical protein
MEWYSEGKVSQILEGKHKPQPFRQPEVPYGLPIDWTKTDIVAALRLTTKAMARPAIFFCLSCLNLPPCSYVHCTSLVPINTTQRHCCSNPFSQLSQQIGNHVQHIIERTETVLFPNDLSCVSYILTKQIHHVCKEQQLLRLCNGDCLL